MLLQIINAFDTKSGRNYYLRDFTSRLPRGVYSIVKLEEQLVPHGFLIVPLDLQPSSNRSIKVVYDLQLQIILIVPFRRLSFAVN